MHEAAQGLLARHVLQPPKIEIVEPQIALECDLEHFEVEPLLALEMVIDRRLIDARLGDDRPNAGAVIAPLREEGDRGLHDVLARIFGWAGHLYPGKNSNKRLNSAYAGPCVNAIGGSLGAPLLPSFHTSHTRQSFFGHTRVFEFQMSV